MAPPSALKATTKTGAANPSEIILPSFPSNPATPTPGKHMIPPTSATVATPMVPISTAITGAPRPEAVLLLTSMVDWDMYTKRIKKPVMATHAVEIHQLGISHFRQHFRQHFPRPHPFFSF